MVNRTVKLLIKSGVFLSIYLTSLCSFADGSMRVISDVLEEVRITVSVGSGESSIKSIGSKEQRRARNTTTPLGSVLSVHVSCIECATITHQYGKSTRLINPFGAERPIDELESWSGSRAEVHYRTSDNYIELIKILP